MNDTHLKPKEQPVENIYFFYNNLQLIREFRLFVFVSALCRYIKTRAVIRPFPTISKFSSCTYLPFHDLHGDHSMTNTSLQTGSCYGYQGNLRKWMARTWEWRCHSSIWLSFCCKGQALGTSHKLVLETGCFITDSLTSCSELKTENRNILWL